MASVFDDPPPQSAKILRWFSGVPVATNPLILLDLFPALALLWIASVTMILAAQRFFGGALASAHFQAATIFASYLTGALLTAFLLAALGAYRNCYGALFHLDRGGATCETMRGRVRALSQRRLPTKAFPIEPILNPRRSVTKEVSWSDVKALQCLPALRVILLKGRFSTLMRIYCPDSDTYQQALEYCRSKVG